MLKLDIWWFIGCAINVFTVIYMISKITNTKINFKHYKFYLNSFLLLLMICLNCIYVTSLLRIIFSTIFIVGYGYFTIEKNVNKIVVATILEQVLMTLSEITMLIVTALIFGKNTEWQFTSIVGQLYTNLTISMIAILLVNLKSIIKLYNKIIQIMETLNEKRKYLFIFLLVVTINIFLAFVYIRKDLMQTLFINILFIIIYSFIMYFALKKKDENMQFKIKNKVLTDNLSDYEKMLDNQRTSNHENKNQLLVIKNMLKKKEEGIEKYIDEIIKDKKTDNKSLYMKVSKIPSGGMQGIVYQKLLSLEELEIPFNLNINKNIRNFSFEHISSKDNYDICRIIGIFLDNAIEAVKNTNIKEVKIGFSVEEDVLNIEISNTFKNIPDLEKIDLKGYTTKGSGHGYGLSLVREIVSGNKKLFNERMMEGNLFTQILKIKM